MLEIAIVHEHKDWLLCHKPAGVGFHNEETELGFFSLISNQVGYELWPVHRLDKPTSGLILVAKSKSSCAQLCELFSERKVEKYYLAICPSSLKKKQGKISGDMAKSRRGSYKLLKSLENPAITQFISAGLIQGLRLCLLKPKTGKTHQLRVALKSLGAAITGDELYASEKSDRVYLHAYGINFTYEGTEYNFLDNPISGELFLLPEFTQQLAIWSNPWELKWPK